MANKTAKLALAKTTKTAPATKGATAKSAPAKTATSKRNAVRGGGGGASVTSGEAMKKLAADVEQEKAVVREKVKKGELPLTALVKVVPTTNGNGKKKKDAPAKITEEVATASIEELTDIEKARGFLLAQLGKGLTYDAMQAREQKATARLNDALDEYEAAHKEYLMVLLLLDALDAKIEASEEEEEETPAPQAKGKK